MLRLHDSRYTSFTFSSFICKILVTIIIIIIILITIIIVILRQLHYFAFIFFTLPTLSDKQDDFILVNVFTLLILWQTLPAWFEWLIVQLQLFYCDFSELDVHLSRSKHTKSVLRCKPTGAYQGHRYTRVHGHRCTCTTLLVHFDVLCVALVLFVNWSKLRYTHTPFIFTFFLSNLRFLSVQSNLIIRLRFRQYFFIFTH